MTVLDSKILCYSSTFSPIKIVSETIQLPLKPYELVVKTKYTTLNPIDIKVRSIAYFPSRYRIGSDYSGVVEHVGSDLTSKFKPGDRVCGFIQGGAFIGTRSLIDSRNASVIHVPKGVSDEEAAAFPLVFATAWALVDKAEVNRDSKVVVLGGATAVGTFVLQLLKKYVGVKHIVSINSSRSNELVESMGADETIDYRAGDVAEALKRKVAQNGRYTSVVDTVGGNDVLKITKSILVPYSEGASYVTCAGDSEPDNDYKGVMLKALSGVPRMLIRQGMSKQLGLKYALINADNQDWPAKIPELFEKHHFTVPIDSVYPLADFSSAIEKMENMKARGKILINFEGYE